MSGAGQTNQPTAGIRHNIQEVAREIILWGKINSKSFFETLCGSCQRPGYASSIENENVKGDEILLDFCNTRIHRAEIREIKLIYMYSISMRTERHLLGHLLPRGDIPTTQDDLASRVIQSPHSLFPNPSISPCNKSRLSLQINMFRNLNSCSPWHKRRSDVLVQPLWWEENRAPTHTDFLVEIYVFFMLCICSV